MQENDDKGEVENEEIIESAPQAREEVSEESEKIPAFKVKPGHENDPDYAPEEYEKAFKDKHANFNPDGALSPREFNRNGEYMAHIRSIKSKHSKELRELRGHMAEMDNKVTAAMKAGYEKALADIQAQRRQAVEVGDIAAFETLDTRVQDIRKDIDALGVSAKPKSELSDEAKEFLERNAEWLNTKTDENTLMFTEAKRYEAEIVQLRAEEGKAEFSERELAKRIETYIHYKFPHRFANSAQGKPAAVGGSDSASLAPSRGKAPRMDDLDEGQQVACKRFIAAYPGKTVGDYVQLLEQAVRR